MFIPPQEEVKLAGKVKHNFMTGNEITSNREVSIGPFKGMSVYSSEEKLKNKLTVIMNVDKSIDASNYVRICREEGWCDTIPKQDGSLESINQIRWGKKKRISSILVPEGIKVEYGTLKPKYASKIPIVIFGPHLVEGLEKCVSKDFDKYYMQITESGTSVMKKKHPKKEKGKIYYEKVEDIDSHPGDMALLCSKKGGMGICLQQGETSDSIYSELENRQCQFNIKSINIPPSLCVTIKTNHYQEKTITDTIEEFDDYPYFTITKIYATRSYGTSKC
ncbi:uncharacterized protein LOC130641106 [Hydractinia symbiolongicarpus]|nr:uncharacterized protein LOC130641106 [Hydractinia symbiolongicarpus]